MAGVAMRRTGAARVPGEKPGACLPEVPPKAELEDGSLRSPAAPPERLCFLRLARHCFCWPWAPGPPAPCDAGATSALPISDGCPGPQPAPLLPRVRSHHLPQPESARGMRWQPPSVGGHSVQAALVPSWAPRELSRSLGTWDCPQPPPLWIHGVGAPPPLAPNPALPALSPALLRQPWPGSCPARPWLAGAVPLLCKAPEGSLPRRWCRPRLLPKPRLLAPH